MSLTAGLSNHLTYPVIFIYGWGPFSFLELHLDFESQNQRFSVFLTLFGAKSQLLFEDFRQSGRGAVLTYSDILEARLTRSQSLHNPNLSLGYPLFLIAAIGNST